MAKLRLAVPILVLALVVVYLVGGQVCRPGDDPDQEFTFQATDLITGKTVKFPADFKGQVVYLNYFSNT